jgi:hypothetical protein
MKNLNDLFETIAKAVEQNQTGLGGQWFFDYSGHVNSLSVRYYFNRWEYEKNPEINLRFYLNKPNDVNAAYYLIKSKLYEN